MIKVVENELIKERFNCGFDTMRSQATNINIKFYLILILFVLFDVELLFVYGYTALSCVHSFYAVYILSIILIISYIYEINEGLLIWL